MYEIAKRNDKVAFIGLGGTGSQFTRMCGFTEFSVSKNPVEYSRRYIDEKTERSDVVSYSPSISYSFDKFVGDEVHNEFIEIADKEMVGGETVRYIVIVDMSGTDEEKSAVMRSWTVIPDGEGNDTDVYTYSGTLKANGEVIVGRAQSDDGWMTCTFTEV